jgi:myo-inositol catabolism protein IolC
MDALREAEAKLTVYVHPSNAADVRRAVARQLSSLLFSCVLSTAPLLILVLGSMPC